METPTRCPECGSERKAIRATEKVAYKGEVVEVPNMSAARSSARQSSREKRACNLATVTTNSVRGSKAYWPRDRSQRLQLFWR